MRSIMIEAIRASDPEIMSLFGAPFSTALKWAAFLDQYFGPGDTLTINKVLDSGERWYAVRFQALYIACWIYHPVEKGSYMIRLTSAQKKNAEAATKNLSGRWSSHLKGSSYSAGKNFEFVKGYSELLVMVYEDYLFLKMEGHSAFSYAHLKAYREKKKTGAGGLNSAALHNLATDKPQYGIIARAAENYSKEYEAFLIELGLKGKTITLSDTLLALQQRTRVPLANPITYEQAKPSCAMCHPA